MSHHGEQEMDDDNDATNTAASTVDANDNFAEPTLPSQTLYLSNLNEKIKIPELKKSLYELCSAFGPVLDVVASKGVRLRGQAWVVFRDLDAAGAAKRALHDTLMFEKAIQIQFAKDKSDVVAKADGTFVRRTRPKRAAGSVNREADPEKRAAKKRALEAKNRLGSSAPGSKTESKNDSLPPNKLLFADNLPDECTEMMLAMLFRQYDGFAEVRMVPGKAGIAFVEFGDAMQATTAKNGLQGFKITVDKPMRITFAKQ